MISAEKRPHLIGLLLCAAFFALYAITLQRHVSTADNAEFQLVGMQLGLAHPPGFPLYTLLAHAATRLLPTIAPHVAINVLAALTSSLTLLFVYWTTWLLCGHVGLAAATTSVLGTATTFWQQAVYANVRSMTALFAAICLWALIRWHQTRHSAENSANRALLGFAVALGLGITHHLSLAFMGLMMVLWVLSIDWRQWWRLSIGTVGLLPWIYLPLVSAELRHPDTFITYALGLGFGGDFFAFITPAELWARAGVMSNVLTFQLHWLAVGLALVGLLLHHPTERAIALLLIATFGVHTFITATYRAPQTVEYMLPAYLPFIIGLVLASKRLRWKHANTVLALIIGSLAVWQFSTRLPSFRQLAVDQSAAKTARIWLANAPNKAEFLSNWHWYNTLRYVNATESRRTDVTVTYVAPSGPSYAENWLAGIAAGIADGRAVVATNRWPQFAYQLPPGTPLGDGLLWSNQPADVDQFTSAEIVLGDTIHIVGFQRSATAWSIGNEYAIEIAWQPLSEAPNATLFAHLVDNEGVFYAQADVAAQPQAGDGVTITQLRLTPRLGAVPGNYTLLVGAYLPDGTPLLDSAENPRTPLTTIALDPSVWQPYTRNRLNQDTGDGTRLIGHDYDCTLPAQPRTYHHFATHDGHYFSRTLDGIVAPADVTHIPDCNSYVPLGHGIVWLGSSAVSGLRRDQTVKVTQRFVSTRPVTHDLAVSLSLTGFEADGATWAWQDLDDSIPAMGAIPTLKWIAGSHVHDPHWVTVPSDASVGQAVAARLTLYDAFTNRPIPILDERITALGGGIPIFQTTVKR